MLGGHLLQPAPEGGEEGRRQVAESAPGVRHCLPGAAWHSLQVLLSTPGQSVGFLHLQALQAELWDAPFTFSQTQTTQGKGRWPKHLQQPVAQGGQTEEERQGAACTLRAVCTAALLWSGWPLRHSRAHMALVGMLKAISPITHRLTSLVLLW